MNNNYNDDDDAHGINDGADEERDKDWCLVQNSA